MTAFAANWPAWRGPLATGASPDANPPIEWSETKNVKWKVAVPGRGSATPIVWEHQIFLLTAIPAGKKTPAPPAAEPTPAPESGRRGGRGGGGLSEAPDEEQQFTVLALNRTTGKTLWQHTPRVQLPHAGHHRDHGFASASPVTDGEVLIAHFGSFGTYAYDLKGRLLWEKDFGDMRTRNSFGEGSSPALSGNTVVVLWDHEGEDFIVALDRLTGKELWRQQRDEPTGWCTPLIVEHGGRKQVVVNGTNRARGYDLLTGEALWESGGQTANAIPSAVAAQSRVYVMSGFRGAELQAITLGRQGNLTGSDAIAWRHTKSTPYVPSPLLVNDFLYFLSGNNALLSAFDATTGKAHFEAERIEGLTGVYASPVAAAGRVYLVGRDGGTVVLKAGSKLETLAKNNLDDGFDASPVPVGKALFLRGRQNLYCLGEPK
jgi:outer membrane protein assembly factor BamB